VAKSRLQTFNARFEEEEYDETWAALAVADHIGSDHTTLAIDDVPGNWTRITELLLHAGQPFADTSLFAVNALCRLIRRHVTVALSGDGGDEAFGGYDTYWHLPGIVRLQALPDHVQSVAQTALASMARIGLVPEHLASRLKELGTDDISIVQDLFCWIRGKELSSLCIDHEKLLPIRRLFEPQWEYHMASGSSRLERLSAYTTEVGVRLSLANDFLFKVDAASMKESLEVRVPMLDEDLFAFGLSLPHELKAKGRTCKRVLRAVAERRLPLKVAHKPKWGFGIPVDKWVDTDFKVRLRDELLSSRSRLSEFFRPEAYRGVIEAFCDGHGCSELSRQGLYQRAIMFLSVQLALTQSSA
jgi:asparagine synthase (glutamine-hydrolysing)